MALAAAATTSAASPTTFSTASSSISGPPAPRRAPACSRRRWRRVWVHMPEPDLRLGPCDDDNSTSRRLPGRDAAFAACEAPAIRRLDVATASARPALPSCRRVAGPMRFDTDRSSACGSPTRPRLQLQDLAQHA
ncbi:unnamed protein product [Urochloa humidicola]